MLTPSAEAEFRKSDWHWDAREARHLGMAEALIVYGKLYERERHNGWQDTHEAMETRKVFCRARKETQSESLLTIHRISSFLSSAIKASNLPIFMKS